MKDKATKAAQKLLSAHNIDEELVPIKSLAMAAGCVVKFTPLDDDLSGMAFVKEDQRVIIVNSRHHKNRQRFTLAHELGHHQLHIDFLKEGVHVDKIIFRRNLDSAFGIDDREVEANTFAAELLMPKKVIKKLIPPTIDLQDEDQLMEFSARFGVSAMALYYRITNVFK